MDGDDPAQASDLPPRGGARQRGGDLRQRDGGGERVRGGDAGKGGHRPQLPGDDEHPARRRGGPVRAAAAAEPADAGLSAGSGGPGGEGECRWGEGAGFKRGEKPGTGRGTGRGTGMGGEGRAEWDEERVRGEVVQGDEIGDRV